MKKKTGIWIDSSKAIIVTFSGEKHKVQHVESNIESASHLGDEGDKGSKIGGQAINHEKKFEEKRKHQEEHYLSEISNIVSDSDEIYLFGPASTKSHLEKRINNDNTIQSQIIKIETADSMTENQIVAKARTFFGT